MSEQPIAWDSPLLRNDTWLPFCLSKPRNLTVGEFRRIMPPRGPRGSIQNRVRGARIRTLNNRGFTVHGKRISSGK